MTLESSKYLGGIGAILALIGIFAVLGVPYLAVLILVGVILILVSLYGLATIYSDKAIFTNSLYGFVAGIIGSVVAAVVVAIDLIDNLNSLKTFILQVYPNWDGKWSDISSVRGMTPITTNISISSIVPFIELAIFAIVILWVSLIVWAFFARKSLKTLSTKSSVGLFSTASLLLIIGAVLTIVFIGIILIGVALLLMAIGFFQMKPPQPEQPMVTYAAPSQSTMPTPV